MSTVTERNWFEYGVKSGWIEAYEQESVRFMEQEFGGLSDAEKLCAVFISLFYKAGHTALPLHLSPKQWAEQLDMDQSALQKLPGKPIDIGALQAGKLICKERDLKPFVIEENRLSYQKIWKQEQDILAWFTEKEESFHTPLITPVHVHELENLFKGQSEQRDWQKVATALSVIKPALIISGGPGTGKTTTVARILAFQQSVSQKPLKIALAAPTGKAAGRMGEALFSELESMSLSQEELNKFPKEAKTVHRLLSGTEERGLLPPVEKKVLQYDLVVVDEASMIDLNLMHRLLTHLSDKTRLILLGDKDQLASVEAGSVFADLCQKPKNGFNPDTVNLLKQLGITGKLPESPQPGLDDSILYLTKSYRFGPDSGIGKLADSIKLGKTDSDLLSHQFQEFDDIQFRSFLFEEEDIRLLTESVTEKLKKASSLNKPMDLLQFWKESTWLTVLRRGLTGTDRLNRLAEQQIALQRLVMMEDGWYHGRPVIITQNDYNLGVFNGDLGVCVKDEEGSLWLYVESRSELRRIKPERIPHFNPAFFLTVHKSQGSEFEHVNLLLPQKDTPILSRELLYTAITRARKTFSLYGQMELLKKGIERKTERFTGLRKIH